MIRYNKDIPTKPCIGMKVCIRDLSPFDCTESPCISGDMYKLIGRISRIKSIYPNSDIVDLETVRFHWNFKWLEPIEENI